MNLRMACLVDSLRDYINKIYLNYLKQGDIKCQKESKSKR
jgi:hypothetical protein